MTDDRALMMASEESLSLWAELVDTGLEDHHEATLKIAALCEVLAELRARVERIADERAERVEEPYDSGWVHFFNQGGR